MEKLKIYNVKKLIEEKEISSKRYTTFNQDELAVIEGKTGVLVFSSEGVGKKLNLNEDYTLDLNDYTEKDVIYIMPQYNIKIPINEIKEAEYREDFISCFIRMFGNRLEQNFNIMLDAINEIGLNSEDYFKRDGKFFDRRS